MSLIPAAAASYLCIQLCILLHCVHMCPGISNGAVLRLCHSASLPKYCLLSGSVRGLQGQAAVGGVSLYMMKSHYKEFAQHGAKGLAEAIGEGTHAQLALCAIPGTGTAASSSVIVRYQGKPLFQRYQAEVELAWPCTWDR